MLKLHKNHLYSLLYLVENKQMEVFLLRKKKANFNEVFSFLCVETHITIS